VANSPADVIVRATSEPVLNTDCEKVCPRFSIDFRALAVDHLRQTIGLLLHVSDDFVGLAGHGGTESTAGGKNRAFDFRGGRLDL
jgi:hypothetical protein